MQTQPILPIASMNIPALLAAHNSLAPPRAVAPLDSWKGTRCKLAERVAILRTQRVVVVDVPKPKPKRKRKSRAKFGARKRGTPIRSAIMKALSVISHYEKIGGGQYVSKRVAWRYRREDLLSVGLSYPLILALIQRAHPESKVSRVDLRWTASMVRDRRAGFESCTLPQKRPHGGTKGRR